MLFYVVMVKTMARALLLDSLLHELREEEEEEEKENLQNQNAQNFPPQRLYFQAKTNLVYEGVEEREEENLK